MDVNINAPSINLTMTANSMSAGFGIQAVRDPMFNIAHLNGKMTVGVPALTKRVADGTQILNQLWVDRTAAIVGYVIDPGEEKFRVYSLFSCRPSEATTFEQWLLYKNSPNFDPYEFTFENAPSKLKLGNGGNYDLFRGRSNFNIGNADPKTIDIRLCMIMKDGDGNEIDRIYSSQYRFVVSLSGRTVSKTRTEIAPTNSADLIDIGIAQFSDFKETFNWVEGVSDIPSLMPLVSTLQTEAYRFIVPDNFFTNQGRGLSIVSITGDGRAYVGSMVYKAENAMTLFSPNGTEYKVTVDNSGVLTASPAS